MSKNLNIDVVRLGVGHSLVLSNLPEAVQLGTLNKMLLGESSAEVQSFGLFEASTPNYSTYYPDVTPEDLMPKESDFINPVFRALSEVIVHKNHNPIDFSKNNILRPSMNLLKGQTVNIDHETALGNAIGAIADVEWQDEYKVGGITIPAGINTKLKIDGKSNPRIARGIQQDPPSIHSTSVTVEFAWEPSHPKMDRSEFFSKLGTFDEEGQMIRRIVTKVIRYNEVSLVSHGADPFAQKIGADGKINNPIYAGITYNSAEEAKVGAQYFFMDFKQIGLEDYEDVITNSYNAILRKLNNHNTNNQKSRTMFKTLFIQLCALAALDIKLTEDAEPSQEQCTQLMTALTNKVTSQATELAEEKLKASNLTSELTTLKAKEGNLTQLEAFQTSQTTALRDEVLAVANLCYNNKIPQTIADSIGEANFSALVTLKATYTAQLEKDLPLTCKSCGGHEVSRASATAGNPEGNSGGGDNKEKKSLSVEETRKALAKLSNGANKLHGAEDTEK